MTFIPKEGFRIFGKADTVWDDVDLEEGEWAEYDDHAVG